MFGLVYQTDDEFGVWRETLFLVFKKNIKYFFGYVYAKPITIEKDKY